MKRLILVLMLALQFVAITGVATAEPPWPTCLPCNDPPSK
jgi:hypothetical protein